MLNTPSPYSSFNETAVNRSHTFDRMLYEDRSGVVDEIHLDGILFNMVQDFVDKKRTRLVIRVLSESSFSYEKISVLLQIYKLQYPELDFELDMYPDQQGRFNYVTISANKKNRRVEPLVRQAIENRVIDIEGEESTHFYGPKAANLSLIERIFIFENQAFEKLKELTDGAMKLSFVTPDHPGDMEASELLELWRTFRKDLKECEALLETIRVKKGKSMIFGVRNEEGKLIAVALYDDQSHTTRLKTGEEVDVRHGECTEVSIHPDFQKNGLGPKMLIALHAFLVSLNIRNVWTDLRCPDPQAPHSSRHSLRAAIRTGRKIFIPHESETHRIGFVATQHVPMVDPDYSLDHHNRYLKIKGLQNAESLRSCARASLEPDLYTCELQNRVLELLGLQQEAVPHS